MRNWLAIDIGNTQTMAGLFEVEHERKSFTLTKQLRFKTEAGLTGHDWLARLSPLTGGGFSHAVVASVVPGLRGALAEALGQTPWIWVDAQTPRNFELKLPSPEQLGADRIANVAGALGRMDPPFVVVDAGTATTFCLVDAHRRYIGGSIVPGMETSFHALASRAARLFEVEWNRPSLAIGNTTESQLQSGIFHAHESLIDGLSTRLMREAGSGFGNARKILTGGCGHFLNLSEQGFEFIPTLTLEGLIRLGLEAKSS